MRALLLILFVLPASADDHVRQLDRTKKRLLSTFDNALCQGIKSSAFKRFQSGMAEARKTFGFVAAAEVTDGALTRIDAAQTAAFDRLDRHWLDLVPLRSRIAKELESRRRAAQQTILGGRYKRGAREALDQRVAALAQVWRDAVGVLALIDPTTRTLTARIAELKAIRAALDPEAADASPAKLAALRKAAALSLDPRRNPLDKFGHAALIRGWRAAGGQNAGADWASTEERELIRRTNEHRVMLGRRALTISRALTAAARGHAAHMERVKICDHNIGGHPLGDTPPQRCARGGYVGSIGENVLVDTSDNAAKWALWLWQGSAPHHRTMMREHFVDIGVGRSGPYWAQVFGKRMGKQKVPGIRGGLK